MVGSLWRHIVEAVIRRHVVDSFGHPDSLDSEPEGLTEEVEADVVASFHPPGAPILAVVVDRGERDTRQPSNCCVVGVPIPRLKDARYTGDEGVVPAVMGVDGERVCISVYGTGEADVDQE